ncbi:MAG: M48 family metalloprotease [Cellvibrionaceae bacterium]
MSTAQSNKLVGNNNEELLASFHENVAVIQSELTEQLTQAQVAGEMDRVIALGQQMREEIEQLSAEYKERVEAMYEQGPHEAHNETATTAKIYEFECDLDLESTVYDGDRDGFLELEADPDIQKAQQAMEEHYGQYNSRKQLLKSSLKMTKAMAPHIYDIGERCKEVLGVNNVNLEFYVYQEDKFNASIYPPSDDKIFIILSSGLLERFSDNEICFVVGHELGHMLFNHHKYPANSIMDFGRDYLSPMHAIRLFSWGRAAELSADRIGLICCQDFTSAAQAFFKLSSGVTSSSLSFHLDEYIKQFSELSAEMIGEQVDPQDWYSTHPFSPLRIKALDIFNRSHTYAELTEKNENKEFTEEQMEREIYDFMSLMEPAHLDRNAEKSEEIQEYLFLAGYLIAMSDGKVDDLEIQTLGKIVDKSVFSNCLKSVATLKEEEIKQEIANLVDELHTYLSPMQKHNMIRDLCLVASADGEIHNKELQVLHDLCYMQNIHPDFADQVLHDSKSELD